MTKRVNPTLIAEIRRRLAAGELGANIAADLGVAQSTVSKYRPKGDGSLTVPEVSGTRRVATLQVDRSELERLSDNARIAAGYTIQRGESLKARVLRTVVTQGPLDTVRALCHAMREGPNDTFGPHEVVSLLHALSKQGAVRFRNSKTAPGVGDMILTRITATNRGYEMAGYPKAPPVQPRHPTLGNRPPGYARRLHAVGRDMTEPANHGPTAKGDDVQKLPGTYAAGRQATAEALAANIGPRTVQEPPAPPVRTPAPASDPVPTLDDWPMLSGLVAEYRRTQSVQARALRLMEAADLLADDSPEEAKALLAKADELTGRSFTNAEAEYLRFAQAAGISLEE